MTYEYGVGNTLLGDRTGLVYGLSPDTIEQSISYAPGSSRMSSYEFDVPDAWSAHGADDQRASFVYAPGGAISTIDWETRPIGGAWAYNSSTVITYDGAERMASWDGNEFFYDSRNLRTRKVDDIGAITDFWYDDFGQLQAELGCDAICDENEPRPLKEYLWLAGRPLAMIISELDDAGEANDSTTAIYDIHTGLLGEPLAITNSAQDVEYQKIHSPFWEFKFDGSTVSTNLRFPGQYEDFETGLFYNWNRYYWPVVGRYTSAEPLLRTPGGVTLHLSGEYVPPFTYAQGSPTAYIDPDGNVAIAVAPVGVAIGVGVLACLAVPSCAEAIRRPFRTLVNECAGAYAGIASNLLGKVRKNNRYQCVTKCQANGAPGGAYYVQGMSNNSCAEATRLAKSSVPRGQYPRHCSCFDTNGFRGTGTQCEWAFEHALCSPRPLSHEKQPKPKTVKPTTATRWKEC